MLKATLLTRVNQITNRGLSSIDEELLETLIEISERTLCLPTSTTGTTTASQNYITKPTDMAGDRIIGLVINGQPYNPISWDDFLNQVSGYGYVVYGSRIYITPTPTGAVSYTVYYPQKHPSDLNTILLDDVYKEAVLRLLCAKVYANYEMIPESNAQTGLYEREIQNLSGHGRTPPVCKPHTGV
ncbi:MAG: hypothetical protein WC364_14410 [Eubacteriales bacterium]|jgi:hypothetical protein